MIKNIFAKALEECKLKGGFELDEDDKDDDLVSIMDNSDFQISNFRITNLSHCVIYPDPDRHPLQRKRKIQRSPLIRSLLERARQLKLQMRNLTTPMKMSKLGHLVQKNQEVQRSR